MSEVVKTPRLADPYGSPPGKPAKYVFYLSRHGDDDTQTCVAAFAAPYAARKYLDVLLGDDGLVWEDECTIRSETGIIVSTRWWPGRLRECVEHDYSLKEMAWTLDPHVARTATIFRHGPAQPRTLEEVGAVSAKRERKSSGPRVDVPTGYVHVSEIALSMGIEAKQARVALRKIFADGKPSTGWNFAPDAVDDIKAKIKEALE